jgi:hypothetical protein
MPSGSAFEHVYGRQPLDYLGEYPNSAALFHEAMTGFSELETAAIMAACDFFTVDSVVDVGAVASTFSRAYRTTGMTQLQRQSSENAATPGNRCSFAHGRACDPTGERAIGGKASSSRPGSTVCAPSPRGMGEATWTPRLAVSAAPSSPAAKTFIHDALGAGLWDRRFASSLGSL